MKTIQVREATSRRASYVLTRVFFFFPLVLSLFPTFIFAGNGPGGRTTFSPATQTWTFNLGSIACAGVVSIHLKPEFEQLCGEGNVTASVNSSACTLTITVDNCSPYQATELGFINLLDAQDEVIETYVIESPGGGGSVLIVLIDD